MSGQKKNNRKNYILKAEPGKYKISIKPITVITEKTKVIKKPKNIALSILGSALGMLVGFIVGGIFGAIAGALVGFIIAVVITFIIGPPKEKIIERNKEKIS